MKTTIVKFLHQTLGYGSIAGSNGVEVADGFTVSLCPLTAEGPVKDRSIVIPNDPEVRRQLALAICPSLASHDKVNEVLAAADQLILGSIGRELPPWLQDGIKRLDDAVLSAKAAKGQ